MKQPTDHLVFQAAVARRPEVSVVMPVYQGKGRVVDGIRNTCQVLDRLQVDYEVVVVDDGSTDETTREIVDSAGFMDHHLDGRLRLYRHSRNIGKGYALRTGFKHSVGDKVVFLDSDMDLDRSQLQLYLKVLDGADVAIASKWRRGSRVNTPFLRKFLSRSFNALVWLLTGLRFRDTQAGFKAVRREALEKIDPLLLVKRFSFDVEFLVVASLLRLRVVEVPVRLKLSARVNLRQILLMLLDLLGIAYRLRIIRWYQENLRSERKPIYEPLVPL